MKSMIAIMAAVFALSTVALAQDTTTTTTQTTTTPSRKKKTVVKTVSDQPVAAVNPQPTTPMYNSSDILTKTPLMSADFGLGSTADRFHLGVGLHVEAPVNYEGNRFRFGGQTGFYIHPGSPSDYVIPIMATGIYDFRVTGTLKPYLGLGIGLSITHYSGYTYDGLGISDSGTNTDFALLIKPGVNFGMNEQYYFEIPFGTMANNFTILPSVGVHF
jgi:opacity protein-like surface antigen